MHKHIELIKTLQAKQGALRRISRPAAATIIGQLVDIVKSPDTDDHTARVTYHAAVMLANEVLNHHGTRERAINSVEVVGH